MKIAVLLSGSGSNLQNILNATQDGRLDGVEVNCIVADRICLGVERGLAMDIPSFIFDRGPELCEEIDEVVDSKIDLIVLAGFLSILTEPFCDKWKGKMINLHPSLLPKFGGKGMYGAKVHQAVLEAKEKESGASVHYVTYGVDEGAVILQGVFPVIETDEVKDLQKKVQKIEHEILIEAIKVVKQKRDL